MKAYLITTIKLLFSILLLWFLVHTSSLNFHILPDLLDNPLFLGITILIGFSTLFCSASRWHLLNEAQGINISLKRTLLPTYLGIAFNNLLPGGVGGDFYRCFYLFRKSPENKSTIMLSILFDRIMGLMGIFIAVCFFSLVYMNITGQSFSIYFITLSIGICLATLLLMVISTLLPKEIGLSLWLSNRYPDIKWIKQALLLLQGIRQYRNAKPTLIKCLFISFIIQVIIALTCLMIAKMLHFPPISIFAMILAVGVTQIANLIPITPGGFGVGEAAFSKVLTLLNPELSASYATIFLAYRFITILPYLPSIFVFMWKKDHAVQLV